MAAIPDNAKRVFTGIIFDVYQWQQEVYDGSQVTFEAIKRPATVQILPIKDDHLLLSYEEQPSKPLTYTFLGGRPEPGEEPLATAKRELLEEAGMTSDNWELIKTLPFANSKIDWPTYLYLARDYTMLRKPNLDPGEKIEVKEVDFEAFIEIVTSGQFYAHPDFIIDVLRMKLDPSKLEAFRKTLLL